MNTISTIGQTMAMDGQKVYSSLSAKAIQPKPQIPKSSLPSTAEEVIQNIESKKADSEACAQQLQSLSSIVTGRKLLFNVNEELNKVIVKVVDTSTNEIIREIPSEDIQKIQARMKHAIGLLFDEMI